ncbi:MAG: beta-hydroxyacyl-ACP dehydratase [Phocaeicola sp.]
MKKSLFSIELLSKSEESLSYQATIDVNHPIFQGHFPEQPVVPGVCTLELVKECLEDAFLRRVRYATIRECKFLATIIPSQHTTLELKIALKKDSSEALNVMVLILCGETTMMKLKASLINDEQN